jgi:pimeloyl-ACP methyl ester carboxylesterase
MSEPAAHRIRARDGLELAALDWAGDPARTPVLCLHGLTRSALDFRALAARQAGRRRVLALDLAGHGDSARAPDPARYGFEAALRDVLDAMAALHAPRAVVVGTSLGGLLGMAMAVVRPGALRGLVLNDIGPRMEPAGMEFVRGFVGTDPALPTIDDAVLHLQRVLPPMSMPDAAAWRRFAAATYARGEDGLFHPRWDMRIASLIDQGAAAMPPLWGFYGALADRPAMLVWGEASHLLSRETMLRMRREKRDLAYVSVPGVGHTPTLEEPEVARALDAFLDGVA